MRAGGILGTVDTRATLEIDINAHVRRYVERLRHDSRIQYAVN
jgi:hypothetical protein